MNLIWLIIGMAVGAGASAWINLIIDYRKRCETARQEERDRVISLQSSIDFLRRTIELQNCDLTQTTLSTGSAWTRINELDKRVADIEHIINIKAK